MSRKKYCLVETDGNPMKMGKTMEELKIWAMTHLSSWSEFIDDRNRSLWLSPDGDRAVTIVAVH